MELTLELRALNRPLVVALNMLDEAEALGLKVDGPGLQESPGRSGTPVDCQQRPRGAGAFPARG